MARAVVIGGGISGLYAARRLALAGHSTQLFEASPRLGGLIQAINLGGTQIDMGAEAFAVSRPDTLNLIHDLGLDPLLVEPAISEARIRTSPSQVFKIPHGLLGIPSNLDDPQLIAAIGPDAAAEAKLLDAQPWQLAAPGTVAELVETRLGKAILETLVTPILAGVHASNPANLEIDAVAPGLFATAAKLGSLSAAAAQIRANAAKPGAAVAGLKGGMTTLINALAEDVKNLRVEIHLNTAATSADFGDITVLATPPAASARLLETAAPDLAALLAQIKSVDVTVVALKATNQLLNQAPLGSGVLVAPQDTSVTAKASTHSTAKWADLPQTEHVIRLSYGRDGLAPAASPELLQTARQDAAILYGINPEDITSITAQTWPGSLIQSRAGHTALVTQINQALEARHPNLALVGAGLGGNGITGILAKANQQLLRIGV